MDTKLGTLPIAGEGAVRAKPWVLPLIAGIIIGVALTSVVAGLLSLGGTGEQRAGSPSIATDVRPASLPAITGTGPGLQVIAEASQARSVRTVSGTGPGLERIARDYSRPAITGTGPGLEQVAKPSP